MIVSTVQSATSLSIAPEETEIEALQRSVTVFEILGNLHCYSEQMDPRRQGRFAALLCTEILKRDGRGENNLCLPFACSFSALQPLCLPDKMLVHIFITASFATILPLRNRSYSLPVTNS